MSGVFIEQILSFLNWSALHVEQIVAYSHSHHVEVPGQFVAVDLWSRKDHQLVDMFAIIGESSDVFMFCLNHQPVDSVDCCSTWVCDFPMILGEKIPRLVVETILLVKWCQMPICIFEILTFSWERRSTLLHFCWLNAHFTKGGSLQNQAEEQITYQLCHMYSRADKSVGYATPAYMADHACHWDARAIFFVLINFC